MTAAGSTARWVAAAGGAARRLVPRPRASWRWVKCLVACGRDGRLRLGACFGLQESRQSRIRQALVLWPHVPRRFCPIKLPNLSRSPARQVLGATSVAERAPGVVLMEAATRKGQG